MVSADWLTITVSVVAIASIVVILIMAVIWCCPCHTSSSTDITPVQYGKSRSRETPALPMYHSDIWTMHENSLPHLAADSIDNNDTPYCIDQTRTRKMYQFAWANNTSLNSSRIQNSDIIEQSAHGIHIIDNNLKRMGNKMGNINPVHPRIPSNHQFVDYNHYPCDSKPPYFEVNSLVQDSNACPTYATKSLDCDAEIEHSLPTKLQHVKNSHFNYTMHTPSHSVNEYLPKENDIQDWSINNEVNEDDSSYSRCSWYITNTSISSENSGSSLHSTSQYISGIWHLSRELNSPANNCNSATKTWRENPVDIFPESRQISPVATPTRGAHTEHPPLADDVTLEKELYWV